MRMEKLDRKARKVLVHKIVADCRLLAQQLIANWQPIDPSWEVVDGCAYVRLSDESQVRVEKGSLEQQLNIAASEAVIRSQQDRKNYRIVAFYIEPGMSGRKDERPQFMRMQTDIEKGLFKFVVVKEASRLSRRALTFKIFFNVCIRVGCEIFIRGFPFNPNDPSQTFQLDIMVAAAEFEANQTSRRVKENVFAAKTTSGKMNSTHKVLGLDQKIVNDVPHSGFYVKNESELKIVEWIMTTFVKYGSFQKTLEECNKRGLLNKTGEPFKKMSLRTLLSNKKYIGTWEINIHNKGKDEKKLMPYDCYREIKLPHGEVIDRQLWDRVQEVVERIGGSRDKNTRTREVYPLSTLLKYDDMSAFNGTGAWGNGGKCLYYFNGKHRIRIATSVVDEAVKQMVVQIVKNSPMLQAALKRRNDDIQSSSALLQDQVRRIRDQIELANAAKLSLEKRLDFLLDGADLDDARQFREQYKQDSTKIRDEIATLEQQRSLIEDRKQELEQSSQMTWQDVAAQARKTLDFVEANDPVALKNAYRELFDVILVGEMEKDGTRPLRFILKDNLESVNLVEKTSIVERMAPQAGFEPATQ